MFILVDMLFYLVLTNIFVIFVKSTKRELEGRKKSDIAESA